MEEWSVLASFPGHSALWSPTPINQRRPGGVAGFDKIGVAGTIRQMSALIRQVEIGYRVREEPFETPTQCMCVHTHTQTHTQHTHTHTHTHTHAHTPCLLRMRAEEQFCTALDVGRVKGIEWTGERGV